MQESKTIEMLDPNFLLNTDIPQSTRFYNVQEEPFQIYGLVPNEEKSFCRLPLSFLPQCSEGVRGLSRHTAGACVRFSTDAPSLAAAWELRAPRTMPHITACGQSGLELFEETEDGKVISVKNFLPFVNEQGSCELHQTGFTALPGGLRHYALYLPLYNGVNQLWLGFPPEAQVKAGRVPGIAKPIVFYGSSITQGGCAAKVGSCYTTLLARRLDAAHVNLGFSGNGKGEESMARYIAGLEMSAFVMDYDHNAPTVAHLQNTHETFFRVIREAQPDLPVIMVSKPDFHTEDPTNAERREVIRRTWQHALDAGDRHVYFVDGETFFGQKDRDLCTVDGCHPTSLGFLRMADGLEPVLRQALKEAGKVK